MFNSYQSIEKYHTSVILLTLYIQCTSADEDLLPNSSGGSDVSALSNSTPEQRADYDNGMLHNYIQFRHMALRSIMFEVFFVEFFERRFTDIVELRSQEVLKLNWIH